MYCHIGKAETYKNEENTKKSNILLFNNWIILKVILLIGFCISFSIELMQLVLCRGMFDVDDIIHNSLGFLIGIVIINKVVLMNKIS